jgi:hypothetical protein
VTLPNLSPGEELLAAFLAETNGQNIVSASLRELTEMHDGTVRLPDNLDTPHEVLFFISSRTGMQVKRPAVGAEGYVLNHLDATATEHYLKNVGDRLMQAFPSNPPYAVFCDSLEVYNQDWSEDFLEENRDLGFSLLIMMRVNDRQHQLLTFQRSRTVQAPETHRDFFSAF